ncbi:MAG: hypothetical protein NC489_14810 [Ruminococcus flavefaciens]|nr:hypothetical protein [Ruminococcus flavefaciens]
MKKLLAILSACVMISCTVCSCGEKNTSEADDPYMLTTGTSQLDESVISPITQYFKGFNEKEAETIIESYTPQVYLDEMKEKGVYENEVAVNNNDIEATYEMWEENYGENSSIEFVEEIYNAQLTQEYLDLAKKYFELAYYDLDSEIDIESGYEISYKYRITGDSSSNENTETACLVHIKDDGWKLIFCSSEVLMSYRSISDVADTTEAEPTE